LTYRRRVRTFDLLRPSSRANECGVRKTLCQTQPIYCSINPPRNYAAWEAAAAGPMVVTNVPGAAPQSRLRPTLSCQPHYETAAEAIAVLDAQFPWLRVRKEARRLRGTPI
jgi:hypothetical protein